MRRLITSLLALCSLSALACTTFILEGGNHIYFGRNLDWDWEEGLVMVNPTNVSKRAFVMSTNAVTWTSKYGSVTFNQFGHEMPFGGMNEAGLVVENMWLTQTQYPPTDERPEINMLQWIQYQLDNFSTVKEVVASDKQIRLENTAVRARIHYLVCDAKGDSATIEFLNGKMEVHHGKDLRYRALANDPYAPAAKQLSERPPEKTTGPLADTDSYSRFCRAASRASAFKPSKKSAENIAYAFETLDQVRQGDYTAWEIVYDVTDRRIHFRTRSNTHNRHVDLKALNYSCGRPLQAADIKAKGTNSGAVDFHDLSEADHRKFITAFYTQESLRKTVGDVTPMIEPYLFVLRSYKCAP